MDDFRQYVSDYPILTDPDLVPYLRRLQLTSSDQLTQSWSDAKLQLLADLQNEGPEAAWANFREFTNRFFPEMFAPHVDPLLDEVRKHEADGNRPQTIRFGEAFLEAIPSGTLTVLEAEVSCHVADAIVNSPPAVRHTSMARAIELYERAIELVSIRSSGGSSVLFVNLGTAYASLRQGDPTKNFEQAKSYLAEAAEQLAEAGHLEQHVSALSNLGLLLISGGGLTSRAQPHEAVHVLSRALQLGRQLRSKSSQAFCRLNLSIALMDSSRGLDRREAKRLLRLSAYHAARALRLSRALAEPSLQARAHHNLSGAALTTQETHRPSLSTRLLQVIAVRHARAAMNLASIGDDDFIGPATAQYGEALAAIGRQEQAVAVFELALETLSADIEPDHCVRAARFLAEHYDSIGRHNDALEAWRTALAAAEHCGERRDDISDRFQEYRSLGTLHLDAAVTALQAGLADQAIQILESGRARELSTNLNRRQAEIDDVRYLDARLADRFEAIEAARASLAADGSTVTHSASGGLQESRRVSDEYRTVVREIRRLPGKGNFLRRRDAASVSSLASDEQPVVYLLASDDAFYAITIAGSLGRDQHQLAVLSAGGPHRGDLQRLLGATSHSNHATRHSYVSFLSGDGSFGESNLELIGDVLGSALASLADQLNSIGAKKVRIIPTGVLGLLPIHAIPWQAIGGGHECLLDRFVVSFAPSIDSLAYSEQSRPPLLTTRGTALVVGNPLPHPSPLPGAEAEAKEIASTLQSLDCTLLLGEDATKSNILKFAPSADVVHFACHASAQYVDAEPWSAHLSLANADAFHGYEITGSGISPSLVVLSACQTGLLQDQYLTDEVLALSTAFLMEGARTAIATLWPVDDLATALLMSHFYRAVQTAVHTSSAAWEPAAWLRSSQIWLRSLNGVECRHYLAAHPHLRRRHHGHPALAAAARSGTSARPFASLEYWAGFVVVGP